MQLSEMECFHFLYRSLWRPPEESSKAKAPKKFKVSILDTISFHEGRPVKWLFTSEHNGEVMKRKSKRLNVNEIVTNIKHKAVKYHGKSSAREGSSKIATVWFQHGYEKLASNIVDEHDLSLILCNRHHAEHVVAVQSYFSGWPLRGCGVFEHSIVLNSEGKAVHRTVELLNRPAPVHLLEITRLDNEIRDSSPFKTKKDFIKAQDVSSKCNYVIINEAHHDILTQASKKILKILEDYCKSNISYIKFTFVFNTAWQPFVLACNSVELVSSNAINIRIYFPKDDEEEDNKAAVVRDNKKFVSRMSSDVSSQLENINITTFHVPVATIDYNKNEVTPRQVDSKKATTKRQTAIDEYISFTTQPNSQQKIVPFQKEENTTKTKQYMLHTDCYEEKLKVYTLPIKGFDPPINLDGKVTQKKFLDYDITKRRPISAPTRRRNDNNSDRADMDHHSKDSVDSFLAGDTGDSEKHKAFTKKLQFQSELCYGDYCDRFMGDTVDISDTDEYLSRFNLVKITRDNQVVLKSTIRPHQITCKSVLLSRAENNFLGERLEKIHNLQDLDYERDEVIALSAKRTIEKICQKCRNETFKLFLKSNGPLRNLREIQDAAKLYRNLVYVNALSQVHPTRFYYTVPVCEACSKMYSALDAFRDSIIYHLNEANNKTIRQKAEMLEAKINEARNQLKEKANRIRSANSIPQQQQNVFANMKHEPMEDVSNARTTQLSDQDQVDTKSEKDQVLRSLTNNSEKNRRSSELLKPDLGGQDVNEEFYSTPVVISLVGNKADGSLVKWTNMFSSLNNKRPKSGNMVEKLRVDTRKLSSEFAVHTREDIKLRRKLELQWQHSLRDDKIDELMFSPKRKEEVNPSIERKKSREPFKPTSMRPRPNSASHIQARTKRSSVASHRNSYDYSHDFNDVLRDNHQYRQAPHKVDQVPTIALENEIINTSYQDYAEFSPAEILRLQAIKQKILAERNNSATRNPRPGQVPDYYEGQISNLVDKVQEGDFAYVSSHDIHSARLKVQTGAAGHQHSSSNKHIEINDTSSSFSVDLDAITTTSSVVAETN